MVWLRTVLHVDICVVQTQHRADRAAKGSVSLIPEERAHMVLVRNYTTNRKINNDRNSTAVDSRMT